MAGPSTIALLLGESPGPDGLGENLTGELWAGYIPERNIDQVPNVQIGPGGSGPPNDQLFEIGRDTRPLAADEIGRQGPFIWAHKLHAHHSAGRNFPLNHEFGPASIDRTLPGLEPTDANSSRYPSPLYWGQSPAAHPGVQPVEIIDSPWTVFYTASPNVGWDPNTSP